METAKKLIMGKLENVVMDELDQDFVKPENIALVKCRICSGEYSNIEFKDSYICEECITYIKENL